MHRFLVPAAAFLLAGCASLPSSDMSTWQVSETQAAFILPSDEDASQMADSFAGEPLYLVALEVNDGTCYVRVVQGVTRDQICQFGEFIRYSPQASLIMNVPQMPGHILGLFDTLEAEEAAD